MLRRSPHPPTDEPPDDDRPAAASDDPATRPSEPDLRALPIAGFTRRRIAMVMGAVLAAWVVVIFARQVSEAAAASERAQSMVAENAAKQTEIAALERELETIQQPRYVAQQARGYGLGFSREIPFSLAPGASPLPADAPGSAVRRLGAAPSMSPLERWLTILFGPGD
jgi:cell division protein FtsB